MSEEDRQTKDPQESNQEKSTQKKWKLKERAGESDRSLMRREDGDDNADNGSHSGPDGQHASSSLARETPSARGGNARK